MIELPVARPANVWIRRERDRRWLRALAAMLITAALVGVMLFLIGWPRLQTTSINYHVIQLRSEVEALTRRERALEIAVQEQTRPAHLAEQARSLGLQPAETVQITILPDGEAAR